MYVPSESFIISERQMIMNTVIHPIPPVFDRNSKILILGSFPSVKSREGHFFYHHPQNRFWKTLAGVLDVPVPDTIDEKKAFLLSHRIALWDVIASCSIEGSSDSSIRDVVPNDLRYPGDLLQRKDFLELLQEISGSRDRDPRRLPAVHESGECGVVARKIKGCMECDPSVYQIMHAAPV